MATDSSLASTGFVLAEVAKKGNATVRLSTTAGKAIYLTEPGTTAEHLIAADTGLRQLTIQAAEMSSTNFRIRRYGRAVQVTGDVMSTGAVGDKILFTMPAGFTSVSYARLGIATSADGQLVRMIAMGQNGADFRILNMPAQMMYFSVTFMVTDPWPSALPGTAVGTIPNL